MSDAASEGDFAADMAALAASIRRGEAENRAKAKDFAARRSECALRAGARQQRFMLWCAHELNSAVRQADAALAPAGYRLTQTTMRPPNCRGLDESRNWIVGQTELALTRDLMNRRLTITLRMDGVVRASGDGKESKAYPECEAEKLNKAYAEELGRQLIDDTTPQRS